MDTVIPRVLLPQEATAAETKTGGPASEPASSQEVYRQWDQRDEAQVVDALKGRYLDEFVYSYCRRHKWVDGKRPPECTCTDVIVGLSWLGVQEAAREYKGIHVPLEKMRKVETEDSIEVTLEAIDTKTDSSRIGIASQSKKLRLHSGQVMDDPFCAAKAMAKAQRNAIRPLLPVTLIKAWIEAHRNHGSVPVLPTEHVAPLKAASQESKAVSVPAQKPPAAPQQPGRPASNGGYQWAPSDGQVKRIFGLAHGHNVSRDKIRELIKTICGVEDPARIASRTKYEALCMAIETGAPF
ncbi:MAG: hypothetical protein A2X35_11690 [Elusimicrobia bacterium GWA2_61_42]|nr:MAG: hypothetical protein A2X35_11690 [Elusimicrobia bacterium GWA2_61_42]OGR75803.1 MAG: hypothetical protein A2X38_07225 [Elusimicrobia bacterium GWC2_61_25]